MPLAKRQRKHETLLFGVHGYLQKHKDWGEEIMFRVTNSDIFIRVQAYAIISTGLNFPAD